LKYLLFFLLVFICPAAADAEVFVHDVVALPGEDILIEAESTGGYFTKRGEVVEFSVDHRSFGSALPNSDGIAYKTLRTGGPGMYSVVARRGTDSGSGNIVVREKGTEIVCIDIEGSLLATPFRKKPIEYSKGVIRQIMSKYTVVYLHTGALGLKAVQEWLRQHSFPLSAVLPWETGDVFAGLQSKGFRLKAVIGSQDVITSAHPFKPVVFRFEGQKGQENLKTWQEIEKKLR
jgi:hypothetical protein